GAGAAGRGGRLLRPGAGGRLRYLPRLLGVEQLVEQLAVVHHRLAQVLRLAGAVAVRVLARGAVVLDDIGLLDRDVLHAAVEVRDGEAARLHRAIDEGRGAVDGGARVIDELRLGGVPVGEEALALVGVERAEAQAANALAAALELEFGALLAAV